MTDSHNQVEAAPGWPAGPGRTRPDARGHADAHVVRARGLLLTEDGDEYRIAILNDRAEATIALGPFAEETVFETCRRLAEASGLPCYVPGPDGTRTPVDLTPASPSTGRAYDRNRLVVLSGRRPRFLVRRKAGRLPVRPLVFREPELAAGSR